jgi:Uma2 family endonuclease
MMRRGSPLLYPTPDAEQIMEMPAARAWTVDMLDALPEDGRRYELIDGVLHVTPAPSDVHQLVVGAFYRALHEYLRPTRVARALHSPADVRKEDRAQNRVQPDVFAVRLIDGKRPPYPYALSDILLAIEVESPGNPLYDYHTKRELYLGEGVPEYWIVNPEARVVSRWRGGDDAGEVLSQLIEWMPEGMRAPLEIQLPRLFEDALE